MFDPLTIGVVAVSIMAISGYFARDSLRRFVFGWRIAIGGERAVGKTRLHDYLEKGEIFEVTGEPATPGGRAPVRYRQTIRPVPRAGRRIKLEDVNFKV